MRDRVVSVLATYAEGGTLRAARDVVGISAGSFYSVIHSDAELKARLQAIQLNRSEMFTDEAYGMVQSVAAGEIEPRRARVAIDGLTKLAGMLNPERFGDRLQVDMNQKLSLAAPSLTAGLERLGRDLATPLIGQTLDVPYEIVPQATDKQSDAASPAIPNIFDD